MQDLIERRAALTALCEDCKTKYNGLCPHPASRCVEFRTIKQLPAIESEPVRHGRWIVHTTWHGMFGLIHSECSECKFDRNGDLSSWQFCPNCGARMDGGGEQE